jgi:hypothetical protein
MRLNPLLKTVIFGVIGFIAMNTRLNPKGLRFYSNVLIFSILIFLFILIQFENVVICAHSIMHACQWMMVEIGLMN